ncbi:Hypothetical predicted protein [Octopus vulgaris]|uniref:COX assembly mitochondrial protein n=1 Tax=Octopus vulgaris TaxID=6645 RepID=A0AA36FJ45_OCTVU|nr:Hypothetical predicted protein [Octopus vulgaris]
MANAYQDEQFGVLKDKYSKGPFGLAFGECAKQAGLLLTFQCRDKANLLHTCLSNMYKNEEFVERCTQEYLKDRTEYRRTGKKKLIKRV